MENCLFKKFAEKIFHCCNGIVITDLEIFWNIKSRLRSLAQMLYLLPIVDTNYLVKNGLKNGFWLSVDIDAYSSKSIFESCFMQFCIDGIFWTWVLKR